MAVGLISNEVRDNNLGLVTYKKTQSRLKRLFSKPTSWVTKAPNNRVAIKRHSYKRLFRQYENLSAGAEKAEIKSVLTALSTGAIEQLLPGLQSNHHEITELKNKLDADTKQTFSRTERTISDAMNTTYGYVANGKGKDGDLATIITTFSHLYANKTENPVLPNDKDDTVADFLRHGIDPTLPEITRKKLAIDQYCAKLAAAIQNIINMHKSDLDMAFPSVNPEAPGDDVKNRIVRDLKIRFNRFARSVDYPKEFKNVEKEIQRIEEKRKEAARAKKKNDDYELMLSESELAMLDATRKKNLDNTPITYELTDINVNALAEQATAKKQRNRRIKKVMFAISIVFALIVAGGQMAIALGGAAGALAVIVGIASFATNYFLFQRDLKAVMTDFFTGKMFKGLSGKIKVGLGFYFVFSAATGIVSGGLVLDLFLKMMGLAIISAPAGPFAIAGVVALLTVVGMTALFFAVGVGVARKLNGKTFSELLQQFKAKTKAFFKEPALNLQATKIKKEIRILQEKRNGLAHDNPYRADIQTQIKFLEKKKIAAVKTHKARHILKIILTFVLFPLAVAFALIATVALMRVSVTGTFDFLHNSLNIAKNISEKLSSALTWGFAVVVNGALYVKNLTVAASFFSDKLAKFFTGVGYGVAMFCLLAINGKLLKAIKDGYHAFKNNPAKAIYPGLRAGLLIACGALVAANAHGNAALYRDQGTVLANKLLTYLASFSGSSTLNFLAIVNALTATPIKKLTANDGTNIYSRTGDITVQIDEDDSAPANDKQLAAGKDKVRPGVARKGFFGLFGVKFQPIKRPTVPYSKLPPEPANEAETPPVATLIKP